MILLVARTSCHSNAAQAQPLGTQVGDMCSRHGADMKLHEALLSSCQGEAHSANAQSQQRNMSGARTKHVTSELVQLTNCSHAVARVPQADSA